MRNQVPFCLKFLVCAFLVASPAGATLISNGTPSGNGASLDISGDRIGAEFFTLSSSLDVVAAEFAGEFYSTGAIDYYIFDNSGDEPSTLVASGVASLVSTAPVSQYVSVVSFNFVAPVALTPGTYWLGINIPSASFTSWGATTSGSDLSVSSTDGGNSWTLEGLQVFLGVSDEPLAETPEPGSLVLAGLGLVALAWKLRR